MTDQEIRQARRIVRNLRQVERQLFDVVDELQTAALLHTAEPYDWSSVNEQLEAAQSRFPLIFDLVLGIRIANNDEARRQEEMPG